MSFRVCWRLAENFRKRVSETALRLKATPVSRFFHAIAFAHLTQSNTHAARAMICLECHSIMALKLSPCRRRIDGKRGQFLVRQAAARRALNFRAQTFDQFRRTRAWIERVATQARSITAFQSVARCREEIHVFACRLFRRARRPAKNSGRAYTDVKDSFETRIPVYQCAIHCFGRRQKFEGFHAEKLSTQND